MPRQWAAKSDGGPVRPASRSRELRGQVGPAVAVGKGERRGREAMAAGVGAPPEPRGGIGGGRQQALQLLVHGSAQAAAAGIAAAVGAHHQVHRVGGDRHPVAVEAGDGRGVVVQQGPAQRHQTRRVHPPLPPPEGAGHTDRAVERQHRDRAVRAGRGDQSHRPPPPPVRRGHRRGLLHERPERLARGDVLVPRQGDLHAQEGVVVAGAADGIGSLGAVEGGTPDLGDVQVRSKVHGRGDYAGPPGPRVASLQGVTSG